MACFIVPAVEAVVTATAVRILESKEKKTANQEVCEGLPFSAKLKWLTKLLSGGSAMLAFEHLWHGEIQLKFPFLTNAGDWDSAVVILHEMSTTGVGMALLVTAVWTGMVAVSSVTEKRTVKVQAKKGADKS